MRRRYENARDTVAGLGSHSYRRSIVVYITGNMDPVVFLFIPSNYFSIPFPLLYRQYPTLSAISLRKMENKLHHAQLGDLAMLAAGQRMNASE